MILPFWIKKLWRDANLPSLIGTPKAFMSLASGSAMSWKGSLYLV